MLNWRDYEWYAATIDSPLPVTAVIAGSDENECLVYVGRIRFQNELLPASIIPQKKRAFACVNGQIVEASAFEVLIGTGMKWVASWQDEVLPRGALEVGRSTDGVALFVGRVFDGTTVLVGTFDPNLDSLVVKREHQEYFYTEYEILVEQKVRTRWRAYALGDDIMSDAIVAYHDAEGYPIYVGRAYHDLELLPAKVVPHKNVAYITHDGCEYRKYGVEVLCGGRVHWEPVSFGQLPDGAIVGGHTSNCEILYIGKGIFGTSPILGKIKPTRQRLFVNTEEAYEIALRYYEILIEDYVPN